MRKRNEKDDLFSNLKRIDVPAVAIFKENIQDGWAKVLFENCIWSVERNHISHFIMEPQC